MAAHHPHRERQRHSTRGAMRAGASGAVVVTLLGLGGLLGSGCETNDACEWSNTCPIQISSEGGRNTSGPSQGGASGGEGGGSADGGSATLCRTHSDCTDPMQAKCGSDGVCTACDMSPQCAGVIGAGVCDEGMCVECKLGEEGACTGTATCNLLDKTCLDASLESVGNCMPCSNDVQCIAGHRCIAMEFNDADHGHYCLKASTSCVEPYSVDSMRISLNGTPLTTYCGVDEKLTTCEAVRALVANWRCTGTNGMCSPTMGGIEEAVPGSMCKNVGALGLRCSYACAGPVQCPPSAPQNTCGPTDPGWCGG